MASCFFLLKNIYKSALCSKLNTDCRSTVLNDKTSICQLFDPQHHPIKVTDDTSVRRDSYFLFFKVTANQKTMINLGLIYFAIELIFSIEVALTIPLMLKLRVSEDVYSKVYLLSPIIGFFAQPLLGAYSDKSGRRKQVILVLAISAYIGIFLILNGYFIGEIFGDSETKSPLIAICIVGIGVTILDFAADSCDAPLIAYLLDNFNSNDQELGLNIHCCLGGLGSALGFILTFVNWDQFKYIQFIGDEMQILFVIATVIFFVCLTLTINSIKENKDEIKMINETKIEEEESLLSYQPATLMLIDQITNSFTNLSKELVRLLVVQVVGWIALFSVQFFLTDFIAQSIYNGDPTGSKNSLELALYNQGVKIGSLCLVSFALSSVASAIILEKYMNERYSIKRLYLITFAVYFVSCILMYNSKEIYFILPLCSSLGILITAITTLPYQLISKFHEDNAYISRNKNSLNSDCSLLSSCYFLAQAVVSVSMSTFTFNFGNEVIMIVGAFFGFVGYVYTEYFVIFPQLNIKII